MPATTSILIPTSTISSLNMFGTPVIGPGSYHEHLDDLIRTCGDEFGPDRVGTNSQTGRIKLRFNAPPLVGEETFFGVICNACCAMTSSLALDASETTVKAALFLANVKLTELFFTIANSENSSPVHTVGGWSFYHPDIVGPLTFHEAIIANGLLPETVNWNTLDVQFSPVDLTPGTTFSIEWVALTVWQGEIAPVVSGGVFGGGTAAVASFVLVKGGALLGGAAIVRPINEFGSGGIVVSATALVTSTETRTSTGGAKIKTTVFVDFIKYFDALSSDTVFFLSGGTANGDPVFSLGGVVSAVEAGGDLFDDFPPEKSTTGLEDYRCIYVYNGLSDTIRGIQLWVEVPPVSSTSIILGVNESDDVQEVNLSFFSGIGTFTLDFDGVDVVVTADSDLDIFASNFQNALRNDTALTDVTVNAQMISTTANFIVTFTGTDGRRKQPVFGLKGSTLGGSPVVSISQTSVGSPINAIAESVDKDTTPLYPEFRETTASLPIIVPNLAVNEGFPLWIKRTIGVNPVSTQNDGFFLQIFTQPITIA